MNQSDAQLIPSAQLNDIRAWIHTQLQRPPSISELDLSKDFRRNGTELSVLNLKSSWAQFIFALSLLINFLFCVEEL